MTKPRLKGWAIRMGMALVIFLAVLVVQHARDRTDEVSVRWGNRMVIVAVTPSAFGFINLAEVYMQEPFEFHSSVYTGNPFDDYGGVERAHFPAPISGYFHFHQVDNGGVHWKRSIGAPFWLTGLAIVPLLAMALPIRPQGRSQTEKE